MYMYCGISELCLVKYTFNPNLLVEICMQKFGLKCHCSSLNLRTILRFSEFFFLFISVRSKVIAFFCEKLLIYVIAID